MQSAPKVDDAFYRALGMHAAITAPMTGGVMADAERYARIFKDFAMRRLETGPLGSEPRPPRRPAHLALVEPSGR